MVYQNKFKNSYNKSPEDKFKCHIVPISINLKDLKLKNQKCRGKLLFNIMA